MEMAGNGKTTKWKSRLNDPEGTEMTQGHSKFIYVFHNCGSV